MTKIEKKLFKTFPFEKPSRGGKYMLYVQAEVKNVKGRKTLFLQLTHNGSSIQFIMNKEDSLAKEEGKWSVKPPTEHPWFYYRWGKSYWNNAYFKKVTFLSGKKEFYSFLKHGKSGNGIDLFHHVLSSYSNSVNNARKAEKKKAYEAEQNNLRKLFDGLPKLPHLNERKYLPNYFVVKKDNQTGHCTYCGGTEFPKTIKHNQKVKCPSCGREVRVLRRSVKKTTPKDEFAWIVFPDEDRMMLRYKLVVRQYLEDGEQYHQKELARAILPKDPKDPLADIQYFEAATEDGYKDIRSIFPLMRNMPATKFYKNKGTGFYFSDIKQGPFYYVTNDLWNGYAVPYKNMAPFFKKLYPYFPDQLEDKGYFWIRICYDLMQGYGESYEKLLKTGYYEKVKGITGRYANPYFDNLKKNGSLEEILGVDRRTRHLLGYNPSLARFEFAEQCRRSGLSLDNPKAEKLWETFKCWPRGYAFVAKNTIAKCNYIQKQLESYGWRDTEFLSAGEDFLNEWQNYLSAAEKVGYDVKSKSVIYPKNFRKVERIVMKEYADIQRKAREEAKRKEEIRMKKAEKERIKRERERAEQEAKGFAEIIEKLKTAMNESEEFRKFVANGSRKFIVKVPETPQDLFNEHVALGNCLNSYIGKMARGESLIFFIRRLDSPDKAYYAMEYAHGMIQQIRGKNNCEAKRDVLSYGKQVLKMIQRSPIIQQMPAAVA